MYIITFYICVYNIFYTIFTLIIFNAKLKNKIYLSIISYIGTILINVVFELIVRPIFASTIILFLSEYVIFYVLSIKSTNNTLSFDPELLTLNSSFFLIL